MGKGQTTFFIIIGIISIILVSFVLLNLTSRPMQQAQNDVRLSVKDSYFKEFVKQCMDQAVTKANQEYGLNEKKKSMYEIYATGRIKSCVTELLDNYKIQGYVYTQKDPVVYVHFEEEVVTVNIYYEITLVRDNELYTFESYNYTFPRTAYEKIRDTDTIVLSTDGRAKLIIKAGTKADDDGTTVDAVGLKLLDRNFDGLTNSIVVGNMVYEGLPDGARFTKPVTVSIDFRTIDYPINVNEKSLSIAWWDENLKIWRGLDTTVENGIASAQTSHFTKFAIVMDCRADAKDEKDKLIITPNLFKQEYSMMHPPVPVPDTANLQSTYDDADAGLCASYAQGNAYWLKDGKTYIPTYEKYKDMKDMKPVRIAETVQEVQEKIDYGENGECRKSEGSMRFEAQVPAYYCYDPAKKDCDTSVKKGLQECMDAEGFDQDKTLECQKKYADELTELLTREIIGYPLGSCISGTTTDGGQDPGVLDIEFDNVGGSCISELDGLKVKTDMGQSIGGKCAVTILKQTISDEKELPIDQAGSSGEDGKFHVIITDAKVGGADLDEGSTFCQSCKVDIQLVGTGFSAKGYKICDKEDIGKPTMVDGTCKTCRLDPETGLVLASEVGGDCRCTADIAYCDGDKINAVCYGGVYYENWKNNPAIKETPDESVCVNCKLDENGKIPDRTECKDAIVGTR
jgi:hypothetical protein